MTYTVSGGALNSAQTKSWTQHGAIPSVSVRAEQVARQRSAGAFQQPQPKPAAAAAASVNNLERRVGLPTCLQVAGLLLGAKRSCPGSACV